MARSNQVIRRYFAEGVQFDVFKCEVDGVEFSRPTMRGVKPLTCPEHTVVMAPRVRDNGTSEEAPETPKHHKMWPRFIATLKSHTAIVPVQPYLYGEPGTGKTYTAGLAAKELNLQFRAESCSIGGTEVDFFGFIDANGTYHRTAFRDVWENGGLFLADELDKASPYVLSKLNNAFASAAGQMVEFPDGPIPRHPNCLIVGAGNSTMRGGDDNNQTSQEVDSATMTRFAFLEWDFDEDFEFTLVDERHHKWVRRVQALRKAVRETNNRAAKVNTSPRAILMGAAMREGGILTPAEIEDMTVWQGVNPDTRRTISAAAR